MHQQQSVTIGLGLGDPIGADGAAGTDDIFDDDRLLQRRAHRISEQARNDVAGPPAENGTTRVIGPGGIVLPKSGQRLCQN